MTSAIDISRILNELEAGYGAEAVSRQSLRALAATIDAYTDSSKPVLGELYALYEALRGCKPAMAHLITDTQTLLLRCLERPAIERQEVRQKIEDLLQERKQRFAALTEAACSLLHTDSTVLICSSSASLLGTLRRAAEMGRKPEIIIAAQEKERTKKVVEFLNYHGFKFHIVNSFVVSHAIAEVKLALCGAVTLTTNRLIVAPGAGNVCSLVSHGNVPIYALLTTDKFSPWEGGRSEVLTEERTKRFGSQTARKIYYSHDLAELSLLTGVVSEKGVMSLDAVATELADRRDAFERAEEALQQLVSHPS